MPSAIKIRTLQKTVLAQKAVLSSPGSSAFDIRKAQKIKLEAMAKLGMVSGNRQPDNSEPQPTKDQIAAVKANPNATTLIAEAIKIAMGNTNSEVTTGDGLHWAMSNTALGNPPLLVVCDRERIEIHTTFRGYPDEPRMILLKDIGDPVNQANPALGI